MLALKVYIGNSKIKKQNSTKKLPQVRIVLGTSAIYSEIQSLS